MTLLHSFIIKLHHSFIQKLFIGHLLCACTIPNAENGNEIPLLNFQFWKVPNISYMSNYTVLLQYLTHRKYWVLWERTLGEPKID